MAEVSNEDLAALTKGPQVRRAKKERYHGYVYGLPAVFVFLLTLISAVAGTATGVLTAMHKMADRGSVVNYFSFAGDTGDLVYYVAIVALIVLRFLDISGALPQLPDGPAIPLYLLTMLDSMAVIVFWIAAGLGVLMGIAQNGVNFVIGLGLVWLILSVMSFHRGE